MKPCVTWTSAPVKWTDFAFCERQAVANLLIHECGCNLPFCDNASPEDLERIRFAVLKPSAGDTAKLLDSIVLAQTDWRDLLMAAGFGEDVEAHSAWWPP